MNDQLVPTDYENGIFPYQSRDPDLFLASLERQAERENFLNKTETNASSVGSQAVSHKSKSNGMMAISAIDRNMNDLASTKGKNFALLIQSYNYRRDQIPSSHLKKHSPVEVLCRLNYKVCKKAGLKEIALSWKSLTTISKELLDVKKSMNAV